jgi:hypothetical protein
MCSGTLDGDLPHTLAVQVCVVDEIAHDALQPARVGGDNEVLDLRRRPRHVRAGPTVGDAPDQSIHEQGLALQVGLLVVTADLEQVLDQLPEVLHLSPHEFERLPARQESSCRRFANRSAALINVVKGDRSSWLTSLAKRASRATRARSAVVVVVNASASGSRSGSPWASTRV